MLKIHKNPKGLISVYEKNSSDVLFWLNDNCVLSNFIDGSVDRFDCYEIDELLRKWERGSKTKVVKRFVDIVRREIIIEMAEKNEKWDFSFPDTFLK